MPVQSFVYLKRQIASLHTVSSRWNLWVYLFHVMSPSPQISFTLWVGSEDEDKFLRKSGTSNFLFWLVLFVSHLHRVQRHWELGMWLGPRVPRCPISLEL